MGFINPLFYSKMTSYERKVKKWAINIIKKFGESKSKRYAEQWRRCPCMFLGWKCRACEYEKLKMKEDVVCSGCKPAVKFTKFLYATLSHAKRVKDIKQAILDKL
jgi:hypothetical protein